MSVAFFPLLDLPLELLVHLLGFFRPRGRGPAALTCTRLREAARMYPRHEAIRDWIGEFRHHDIGPSGVLAYSDDIPIPGQTPSCMRVTKRRDGTTGYVAIDIGYGYHLHSIYNADAEGVYEVRFRDENGTVIAMDLRRKYYTVDKGADLPYDLATAVQMCLSWTPAEVADMWRQARATTDLRLYPPTRTA